MAKKKNSPRSSDDGRRVEAVQPSVFISYAHEDETWKDRLEVHCAILKRQGLLSVWDDRRIRTGSDWSQQIREAAERARVAVLLISADFLASDFILNDEIPLLLERREAEGLEIFPLLIKPCGWQHVDWLARMNLRPRDGRPLSTGTEAEIESELVEFASELAQTIAEEGRAPEPAMRSARKKVSSSAKGQTRPSPGAIRVGSRLGSFEILQALGAGGMGEVFVARDANLKRKVALKVLRPEMASDPERLQRFQREAETVAALNHPNIVTLFSIEEDHGIRFLTMELVEGKTLDEIIPARGLPLDRIHEIAGPLIEALASAHNRGIIHRDLKANNVMVSKAGQVKVLDFGLAKLLEKDAQRVTATSKLTEEGLAVGTFPYMSPEQLEGKAVDARTDIYSLGVLLYEMVTGRMPFEAKSSTGLVASILRDNPKSIMELRSRLPVSLDGIIQRCLEKDPDKRYQSALDVRDALQRSQSDELAKTLPPGIRAPYAKPVQQMDAAAPGPRARAAKKVPFVAGAVAAAVVLIVAVLWFMARDSGSESAESAESADRPAEVAPAVGASAETPEPPGLPARQPAVEPEPEPEVVSATPQDGPAERGAVAPEFPPKPQPQVRPPVQQAAPAADPPKPAPAPPAKIPPAAREEPAVEPRKVAPSRTEPPAGSEAGSQSAAAGAPQEQPRAPVAPAGPPPAPQPATPDPPPPEPPPAVDPTEAILRVLDELAGAFESLDVAAVAKLWPAAPREKLGATFELLESQEVQLGDCRIRLAGADRATATCTEQITIVTKRGQKPPTTNRQVDFDLRRSDDTWLVESRR